MRVEKILNSLLSPISPAIFGQIASFFLPRIVIMYCRISKTEEFALLFHHSLQITYQPLPSTMDVTKVRKGLCHFIVRKKNAVFVKSCQVYYIIIFIFVFLFRESGDFSPIFLLCLHLPPIIVIPLFKLSI